LIDTGADPNMGGNAVISFNVKGNWTNNSTAVDLVSKNTTVIFNGSGAQIIGGAQSTTFRNITINKSSGTLSLGINTSIQSGDLTISGGTTDLVTYSLNRSTAGGTMTIATGCTLKLAGASGGPSGSNFPLNFSSMSINSNSTVEYNGSNAIAQTIYAGATYGHLSLTNGTGSGSSSKITTANLTVNGNLTVNSGTILTPAAANTIGGTGTLTGSGTVQVTRTAATADFLNQYTITNRTLSSMTVDYYATAAQTVNTLTYYNLTISGARTTTSVTFPAGTITISGVFTPSATFTSGNYITTGSTVDFNSASAQNIPAFAFNSLTVSGGGAKTATGLISVNGVFTISSTLLTTTAGNLLVLNDNATTTGVSANYYVNGPVKKIGNDAFTFPVGKSGPGYMPISISAPSVVTDAFTAEYMRASATGLGSITSPGLIRVSNCDYWNLNRVTGSSSVNVTLSWNGLTNCNIATYINNLASLTVTHFNGTNWDSHGVNSTTGNASSGTITRNAVSTFSPFALGSTDDYSNPLSIQFTSVKATAGQHDVNVGWKNVNESGIEYYEVQRSANGIDFVTVHKEIALFNNSTTAAYSWNDVNALQGINHYRIKAVRPNGDFQYSMVVKATMQMRAGLVIYPSPATSEKIRLQHGEMAKGLYTVRILSISGKLIYNKSYNHEGGIFNYDILLSGKNKSGLYHLQLLNNEQLISKGSFIIL
jgi:hypothetical protein